MSGKKPARDIYQEVTNRIVDFLDQGVVPWRNPIPRGTGDGWPKNLISGQKYRGINVVLLSMQAWISGFSSDYWVTFKQAKAKGGKVRKGEKGTLVTFWKMYDTKDKESGELISIPVLKHFTAFNLEQVNGIEIPHAPTSPLPGEEFAPVPSALAIVDGYRDKPTIEHQGLRALYRPSEDLVRIPRPSQFEPRDEYYSVLFHELSHSTGHSSRLNRGLDTDPKPFGSPDYSREELVAELSSAFLCAVAGISPPTVENAASYIQSWVNVLKGDKRLVVAAAGAAQKSADWILGEPFNAAASDATGPNKGTPNTEPDLTPKPVNKITPQPPNSDATRNPARQLELF